MQNQGMATQMIRPIILVGMNRSGTKWLSNLISRHPDVIAVQSVRTNGIVETNMFGGLPDKFDLSRPDEYIGLVELWAATQFFKLTGVDKELFYRLDPRPGDGLRLFEILMNEYARRNRKGHWLQKTTPLLAQKALEHFREARVVVIRRDLMETVRSTLAMQSWRGRGNLFRTTWHCVYQRKLLNRLCRRYSVVEMDFEKLRADPAREEARLFAELGLAREQLSEESSFPPNTTFASDQQRRSVLSRRAWFIARGLAWIFGAIPLPVITAAVAVRRLFRRRAIVPLISDTFGELGDRLVDRSGGPVRPRHGRSSGSSQPIARRSDSLP